LALGGNLIAADEPWPGCAYFDRVADLARIDSWEPEHIMALDPDLIFVIMDADYEKLKNIAPTILIPFGKMSTTERLAFIGEVLGTGEKSSELISTFKTRAEDAKAKLAARRTGVHQRTFTILEMWEPGSIMIMGDRWGRGGDFIYNDLGLPAPEKVRIGIIDAEGVDYLLISEEVMPDYCGDIILVTTGDDGSTGFEGSPIWESLPAVKNKRVIAVSWNMFYFDDILSLNAQMDTVVEALLGFDS
jgi:iron complex transport system substrate-binding protein